jgi:predicted RNase H-like HicB family nuclease
MGGKLESEIGRRNQAFRPCFSGANVDNHPMNLAVETEQETDGRWIAEIAQIPGALAYGATRDEAVSRVEALALRVLADRLELGEMPRELEEVFSVAV